MRPYVLPAIVGSGLLAACNFPVFNNAPISSKGLWVANAINVVEYNPAQRGQGTGATAPHVSINSEIFGSPRAVVFDNAGNLWVIDPSAMVGGKATPALIEFSAAQLAALPTDNSPDPVAVITSTTLKSPQQAVIDIQGNAWITDYGNSAVVVYTAAELSMSGTNALAPVLSISSGQFNGPSGIAFDSSGNMWVSNNGVPQSAKAEFGGGTTIVEYAADRLPAVPESGTSTPNLVSTVTLSDEMQASIQSPWALTFDSAGNLWSTNEQTSTVVQFDKANLTNGSPTPTVTISSATVGSDPSLNQPHGICIDDVGDVAVINAAGAFGIAIYGPKQLSGGATVPDTFIAGTATTLNAPQGCTFGPVVK